MSDSRASSKETTTFSSRGHSSRIPTKRGDEQSTTNKSTQHVSKLAKRSKNASQASSKSTDSRPTTKPATAQKYGSQLQTFLTPTGTTIPISTNPRTPSLVSGSSASTIDSPRSNTLRRKQSGAIDRYAAQKRSEAGTLQLVIPSPSEERLSRQDRDESVFGILPPSVQSHGPLKSSTAPTYESLKSRIYERDVIPPGYAPSMTPSTRYTDSPFSHVPTPSSASSYSSSLAAVASANRPRQSSNASQPGSQNKGHNRSDEQAATKLLPVRESSTSSSNSTVRTVKNSTAHRKLQEASTPAVPTTTGVKTPVRNKLRKEPSTSKSHKKAAGVPPELAHLNVATPVSKTPTRPRRDDVAFLSDLNGPTAVIQSDLPRLYTGFHKRTSSQESANHESASSVKSRVGFPPRSSSRGASPRIDSAISPLHPALRPERASLSGVPRHDPQKHRRDSPAVGTAPSPAKSPRFALFSRKPKPEAAPAERPRRLSTKGPVAGTGHEGYGRFGIRGRSTSATGTTTSRSPSNDSTSKKQVPPRTSSNRNSKDSVELDSFLKERLTPVYLRGSGSSWGQTESIQDGVGGSIRAPSSQSSVSDSSFRPSLLPSAMGTPNLVSSELRPALVRHNTSESSDDGLDARFPNQHAASAAYSIGERRFADRHAPNFTTSDQRHDFCIDSEHNSSTAVSAADAMRKAGCSEDDVSNATRALPIKNSGRRWNFFQRANISPRPRDGNRGLASGSNRGMATPVAHYALMDAVQPVELAEVEDLLSDSEAAKDRATPMSSRADDQSSAEHLAFPRQSDRASRDDDEHAEDRLGIPDLAHSKHLSRLSIGPAILPTVIDKPGPGVGKTESPAIPHRSLKTPEQKDDSIKQPRLSPVGRIPPVVRREGHRKLSDASFSRPFARSQPRPSVRPPGHVYSQIRDMASPIEPGSSHSAIGKSPWLESVISSPANNGEALDTWSSTEQIKDTEKAAGEFMSFPDRKNSQQSCVSSSSGNRSHPSRTSVNFAPSPQQEDIWNEYNDLLDAVDLERTTTSALPPTKSRLRANTVPDQHENVLPHPPPSGLPPRTKLPAIPGTQNRSTVLTVPQQVSRFLQPSMSPLTPDTLSAWINDYGNRSTCTSFDCSSFVDLSFDDPEIQHNPRQSSVSRHSRCSSVPEVISPGADQSGRLKLTLDTNGGNRADDVEEALRAAKASNNMRYGAFMTSKWLAFGRILFSPVNNELRFASEARVLVIDGLSSDWSYYIARSYPNTEVYDMTSGSKVSTTLGWDDADASTPANFRRIPTAGLSADFPFPKGFFNAVVLRFPTATTEQSYLACVSECKRVLRPGGYLEVAVLDLDLMNMGSQTRKAVKGLKTRMQIRDPAVCLGNLSDVLVRMIGRRGFENIQRCVVGVPAAGRIRSQERSGSGSDSSGQTLWHRNIRSSSHNKSDFLDLLNETEEKVPEFGPNADESITRMVARVGRWWYNNCYEQALLPADQSIWNQQGLLRECEKQRTSFRLLICQAQKPLQTRRRTVSV